ncbi:RHS domain-containing protein [Cobetia sp. SIMBA_158]
MALNNEELLGFKRDDFQADHLGTLLEVADSDGNLVWVGQYRA